MTRIATTRIAAIATLAAILTAALPAHALVPGSETAERARSNAATNSVVTGTQSGAAVPSRTSYGYARARSAGSLVPASNQATKAFDAASMHGIVQGETGGTIQPSGSAFAGGLIPGSDSFD